MLTTGIPILYTAKIFRPQIKVQQDRHVDFNLATVRRNAISTNNLLSPGDSFVELKIRGDRRDYFIPIDLWDLYQMLSQCGKPAGPFSHAATGEEVLERLQKVGVNLARYEAWRLTKRIPFWPKSQLISSCTTHQGELLERSYELLDENFFKLNFIDLSLNLPNKLTKATFRLSMDEVPPWAAQEGKAAQWSIKVDYEIEPVSVKIEEETALNYLEWESLARS